jgi:GMP synthase-like glutamine amidotransferase
VSVRVGLLECDPVHHERRFAALLPDVTIVPYDVWNGALPASPEECDAWLCGGSRASVYDDEPWIPPLLSFVRSVRDAGRPYVGVCFGHQVLAAALGGRVERAPVGWGAGAHRLSVTDGSSLNLLFMHQDQVVELPHGGSVLGSAEHCPIAMMRAAPAMVGIQPHPEFSADFVAKLLDDRELRIGAEKTAAARASLTSGPTDEAAAAQWMLDVLRGRSRT